MLDNDRWPNAASSHTNKFQNADRLKSHPSPARHITADSEQFIASRIESVVQSISHEFRGELFATWPGLIRHFVRSYPQSGNGAVVFRADLRRDGFFGGRPAFTNLARRSHVG